MSEITDPVERVIADALDAVGVAYVREGDPRNLARLDFFLPDSGVYIEAKRMPSEWTIDQLQRGGEVIFVQGLRAAEAFASLIRR